jgi:hypothetical protein
MNDTLFAGITVFTMLFYFLYWLLCAGVAATVASNKNRSGVGYLFATFFFLGPLGIAVAMLVDPGELREPWPPTADESESYAAEEQEERSGIRQFFRGLAGKWD